MTSEMWTTLTDLAVTEGESPAADIVRVNYHFGNRFSPTNREPFHYAKEPPIAPSGDAWRESLEFERASGDMSAEHGYRATDFLFAPVVWGKYPTVKVDDVWVPIDMPEGDWPPGVVFQTQVVGMAPDWAMPLLVSVRAYRSVAWWTLLEQFQATYLTRAKELALQAGVRTGVPTWAYYMPITVERDAKGKAIYRPLPKRKDQFYTQPVLAFPKGGPEAITEADLAPLFVGREAIERGRTLWRKYREAVKRPPVTVERDAE